LAEILEDKSKKNLAALSKEIGEDRVIAAIEILINNLHNSIMLTQPMTTFMVRTAAELIRKKYYYLKIDEFRICFDMALTGKFGKNFNRLDVLVLCEWLDQYDLIRTETSRELNREQADRNNIYDVFNNDVMRDALKMVVDKLPQVNDKPEPKPSHVNEFDKMVMREWDGLPNSNHTGAKIYDEVLYHFDEFRVQRLKEELNKIE
jgi:hypothetical protein